MILRRYAIFAFLLLATAMIVGAQSSRKTTASNTRHSAAYNSMSAKLDRIAGNGERATPAPAATTISADEASAWVNEGGVKLPAGVDQVKFRSQPAVITTTARVDFDKLTAGRTSYNPLLSFFSGVHDIEVVAQASAARGQGSVHVQTLSIDGTEVPRMAMEFFVDRYLKPKYPSAGLDSNFRMPARVDTAIVGKNEVTVTQK